MGKYKESIGWLIGGQVHNQLKLDYTNSEIARDVDCFPDTLYDFGEEHGYKKHLANEKRIYEEKVKNIASAIKLLQDADKLDESNKTL